MQDMIYHSVLYIEKNNHIFYNDLPIPIVQILPAAFQWIIHFCLVLFTITSMCYNVKHKLWLID